MYKNLIAGAILSIAVATATNAFAADGKATYTKHCAKCHGADGKGQTKMGQKLKAKDYTTAKAWEGVTDAAALKAVTEGMKDKDGKVIKKPIEGINEAEAKAAVDYMKTFKK